MNPIIQFILNNRDELYKESQKEEIECAVLRHLQDGTFLIAVDENGIAGICRWSWDNEETAYIIDVIVRKDLRYKQVLKQLIYLGKQKFPKFKYIRYERALKTKKEFRTYEINKILKE